MFRFYFFGLLFATGMSGLAYAESSVFRSTKAIRDIPVMRKNIVERYDPALCARYLSLEPNSNHHRFQPGVGSNGQKIKTADLDFVDILGDSTEMMFQPSPATQSKTSKTITTNSESTNTKTHSTDSDSTTTNTSTKAAVPDSETTEDGVTTTIKTTTEDGIPTTTETKTKKNDAGDTETISTIKTSTKDGVTTTQATTEDGVTTTAETLSNQRATTKMTETLNNQNVTTIAETIRSQNAASVASATPIAVSIDHKSGLLRINGKIASEFEKRQLQESCRSAIQR